MSDPAITVLIRSKDEAPNIGKVLDILARQSIAARSETIVVDSGSTDGTVDVVRGYDVRLFEMPAEEFTYGRSLNLGCSNARGEVIVALSAHAYPWDEEWLERMLHAFDDEKVACACGYEKGPDGGTLTEPLLQDEAHARRNPRYGYTNASGGFRAQLWREHPFREDMPMTEDKEWSFHWLKQGWLCRVDPALGVDHTHGGESIPSTYKRAFLEYAGLAMYADLEPYGAGALAREWWRGDPAWPTAMKARLSRRRAARLAGKYRGMRVADGAAVGGPS